MRFPSVVPVVLCAALAAPGCASVADSSPDAPLQVSGDVERLQFAKSIQIGLPARLVVVDATPNFTDERRNHVADIVAAFSEDRGSWTTVDSLFAFDDDAALRSARFEDLRQAASRQQSDLMLVVRRRRTQRAESGVLGLLNLLILPAFLVPTREVRTTLDVRAAVVDVRNGLIYATCEDRTVAEETVPAAFTSSARERGDDATWSEAVGHLRVRVPEKLRAVTPTR